MKKVVLFLFALSTIAAAQAQFMSSGGVGNTYSSGDNGLGFSGKISTISSQSEAAVDPSYSTKSKSLFSNLISKKSEPTSVAQESTTPQKSSSYETKLNKIYFSWNFTNESDDFFEVWDADRISFTFGYDRAINVFREMLYVDCGLAVTWSELYYEDWGCENHIYSDFVEVRVPINLMLNLKLTKKIYFRPYAGFALDFNALTSVSSNIEQFDSFEDDGFKFSGQYGAGFSMGRIYLGFEHRKLTQIESVNFRLNSLVLGVTF
ncbi:MAG: hypothetical protein SNG10_03930 [Rikenellaceae bacterium]